MLRRTFILLVLVLAPSSLASPVSFDARSARSGPWSDPATWENGRAPKANDRVQIRQRHVVTYDVASDDPIRMIHVGGTLTFSHEKSTRLNVGLLKIQPGEECSEDGFVCAVHDDAIKSEQKTPAVPAPSVESLASMSEAEKPALEIGTPDDPMPAGVTATIRLVYFDGTDRDALPALVCCGGRMDLHGSPMSRTWVKLANPAKPGDKTATLAEPVSGWRAGDHVILTAAHPKEYQDSTAAERFHKKEGVSGTEDRIIASMDGSAITLDKPLEFEHYASDTLGRCEVADLSRNVVVESADPDGVRGHTMYHRHSAGSISYAEFRHLGKRGILGKYPIHFHLVRDSMRGNGGSVIGASIWDSANRFMAIHGTDYLLVRDCVGYQCVGHGFFLEDATEQYNVLDRNLAVQAKQGKPLKDQVLTFDQNEGAGFWWANGRNTLTRNVAVENHKYGFRFEIGKIHGKPPILAIRQPDGSIENTDVRSVPFFRFEDNESHSEGLYSFFFGDDPAGSVHGDYHHPFIARNLFAWQTHYALRPGTTHFLMEHLTVESGSYGVYHPDYNAHVYRDVKVSRADAEPINRGHDDESIQFGSFTYDGLRLERCSGMPLIQLSCTAPVDGLTGHFKNVSVIPASYPHTRVIDLGVGPILPDKDLIKGVVYFFHGPVHVADQTFGDDGKSLRVVSIKFPDLMTGSSDYKSMPNFSGKGVRVAEVADEAFPKLLDPVDDLPPATMITSVRRDHDQLIVRGVTQDNGEIASVTVNGTAAQLTTHAGVTDWQATVPAAGVTTITASATDQAGNGERTVARASVTGR
jgi:hypothetical protein